MQPVSIRLSLWKWCVRSFWRKRLTSPTAWVNPRDANPDLLLQEILQVWLLLQVCGPWHSFWIVRDWRQKLKPFSLDTSHNQAWLLTSCSFMSPASQNCWEMTDLPSLRSRYTFFRYTWRREGANEEIILKLSETKLNLFLKYYFWGTDWSKECAPTYPLHIFIHILQENDWKLGKPDMWSRPMQT